ncbi:MAG: 4Fe-4S dicluster domain-containing protein [Clostridiales bacterium]|nr:4Fe-4S dicluster domain-containing protein [Clostridiales bacterium]
MQYREFKDKKLSLLGFGAMRLPVIDGDDANVDVPQTMRMVEYAMEHGINYYDTAWGYHGEHSEEIMGEALRRYPRDSYYFADKFPGYDLANMPKVKEIFETQLQRTGLDFFDFYLLHNVCEMNIEQYLDPQYGIIEYLLAQKQAGRIHHFGFSCHGELPVLKRFLEAYGHEMEFCQLQLNYLDWEFQHGKEKVALLKEYDIPIWVMEPLRGGKLAKLDDGQEQALKALRPQEEIPAWAFRFLETLPEVKVILSGMSNEEQLHANVETFEKAAPLQEEEMAALMQVAKELAGEKSVPCTACHYCTDHCPQGLDIPHLIELYNEHVLTTKAGLFGFIAPMALAAIPQDKQPAACLHCGNCEQVCPQQIKISDVMGDFVKVLGGQSE